ncbi:MAG TPA: hypothetical protein VKV19_09255 [Ktedonobacteraceae bacterium]|nr:hypothetical protein [Ktedonobacteraceae bacterium]
MTETRAKDAAKNLMQSAQDVTRALTDSAITTQERNMTFAQGVLENGIEVLKSHAESSRTLMRELVEQMRKEPVSLQNFQRLVDGTIAAQERNTKFAQNVLGNGIEALKGQVDVTRSLMQELGQQFQKQQDAFQALAQESMEAYKDVVFAPLTFWQKTFDMVGSATMEGLRDFQRAAQQ